MAIYSNGQVGWFSGFVAPAGPDADAQAFITAANITNTTQQNAIIKLVTDLKGYGIWTKMKALYPFVGGTAAQHRFNLKDPRAVDAAYYLTFYGGGTHSANGYLPNGNSYADTKLNASTVLTHNSVHLGYYSQNNTNGLNNGGVGKCEIGTQNGSNLVSMYVKSYTTNFYGIIYKNDASNWVIQDNQDSRGFYVTSRLSATQMKGFKNGVQIGNTVTISTNTAPNQNIYLGANNATNVATEFSDRESAFASIGDGLTDTEAANFYTAVQTFQTTLGRQV